MPSMSPGLYPNLLSNDCISITLVPVEPIFRVSKVLPS